MDRTFWQRQTPEAPLFPDLQWSRPEQRTQAGKLLIIGANVQSFAAPASAYATAETAGIGHARVLLPDSLQKTVSKLFPEADFAPSTPSGSFSRKALSDFDTHAYWADGVLLAGDLGRNSETAILLESFISRCPCLIAVTKDALDYFVDNPAALLNRHQPTLVIASFAQLQKLAIGAHWTTAFTFDMGLVRFVEALGAFTTEQQCSILVKYQDELVVSVGGRVSSTHLVTDPKTWRIAASAYASTWLIQQPSKPFEALTTAAYEYARSLNKEKAPDNQG